MIELNIYEWMEAERNDFYHQMENFSYYGYEEMEEDYEEYEDEEVMEDEE